MAKYDGTSNTKLSSTNHSPPSDDGEQNLQPGTWRTKGPRDGEPLERITKDGHTFKWDPTGNNGTEFWDFVKPGYDISSNSKSACITFQPTSGSKTAVIPDDSPKKKANKMLALTTTRRMLPLSP